MAVAALPDAIGGVVARLRSFNEILAFVTTANGYAPAATATQKARPRISAQLQSSWQLGTWPSSPTAPKGGWSLLVAGPIGGPGDDRDGAIQATRVDLHCYGPSPMEAMRFWRQVHPCICPPRGVAEQFTAAGCRFLTVDKEGGPSQVVEPDTRYPKVVATYVLRWSEAATA